MLSHICSMRHNCFHVFIYVCLYHVQETIIIRILIKSLTVEVDGCAVLSVCLCAPSGTEWVYM